MAGTTRQPDRGQAFIRLYTQTERRVYGYVLSLVGNFADADDVMQQVNLRLWQEFERFDPGTSFVAWAFTIARFEVLTWHASRQRSKLSFSQRTIELLADELPAVLHEADARSHALGECMKELPAPSQHLLARVYADGLQIAAAAREAGRSTDATYKLIQRVRQTLRDCIRRRLGEAAS